MSVKPMVAVTGATGMVGGALVAALVAGGHPVRRLVRHATQPMAGVEDVPWNPAARELDVRDLAGVGAVVHLAGENLAQRWTAELKRRMRESRVESTRLLADRIARMSDRPATLVTASAIGIYGDRGDEVLDESSALGTGFLASLSEEWERACDAAEQVGVRVVHPRFGIILSERGGALEKMLPPFKLGAGGTLGDGSQWMSWVVLDDVVSAIRFAIDHETVAGAANITAPNPVTNAQFTDALGHALHRPTVARVPKFALRLMYGEMADAALLASQRVMPATLTAAGFHFAYPELQQALTKVLA
ncbi:MAG: TIGR01777 family oxidoreductase [Gemmatimonadota bacterium]|nr:TIGR01777 family oxidoreductase [Gemmatimonadota bacterium]